MSIATFQQELFEKECRKYFKDTGRMNFDLNDVIQKLKNRDSFQVILESQKGVLNKKRLKILGQALEAQQFSSIIQEREKTRILIQSSYFKDLERMFQSVPKNLYLLKFLLKQIKKEENSSQLSQYYGAIDHQQRNSCQQILDSDQFLMWSKQSHSSKQQPLAQEDQEEVNEAPSAQKENAKEYQQLLRIRNEIQAFFSGFKVGSFQRICQLIMSSQPLQPQLQRLQDEMFAKEYNKLLSWITSNQFIELKKQIQNLSSKQQKDPFLQVRKELQQLFKPFTIDITNLINSILQQNPLTQTLDQLQEVMKAKQYKRLVLLVQSQQLKKIKEGIKNRKQSAGSKKDKEKELLQLSKGIKGFSSKLIQAIINEQQQVQKQQLLALEEQITAKQFRLLQTFLKSQAIIIFRQKLNSSENTASKAKSVENIKKQAQFQTAQPGKQGQQICKVKNIKNEAEPKKNHSLSMKQKMSVSEEVSKIQALLEVMKNQQKHQAIKNQIVEQQNIENEEEMLEDSLENNLCDQEKIKKYFSLIPEQAEKLIKLVLEGIEGDQYEYQVAKIKKNNKAKKIMKRVCINKDFKYLREKLIKKAKLRKIFSQNSKSNQLLLNIFSSSDTQGLLESLEEVKKKIGKQQFEEKSFLIYSNQLEELIGCTLLSKPQYRYFIDYFGQKLIPACCQQFYEDLLKNPVNNFQKVLKKYRQEFSQETYVKIELQLKTKDFLQFIYKLKFDNFDEIVNQIKEMLSFVKNNQRIAEAIFFGFQFQNILEQTLLSENYTSLQKLYPIMHSPQLKAKLQLLNMKFPQFEEKYFVQKQSKRMLYKKSTKISKIRQDITRPNLVFFDLGTSNILSDDYQISGNLLCFEATEDYFITFNGKDVTMPLPHKESVDKIKKIIKAKLKIQNQIFIQISKNDKLQTLQDKSLLGKIDTKLLLISYEINVIFKVEQSQEEITEKVTSNQTIYSLQKKLQNVLNVTQQSQKWYMQGNQIIETKENTFEKMEVMERYVRIKVIQDRSMEYYSFDKIIPIERNQFKDFYIEDDDQTKDIIKKSDFPSIAWSPSFRKICLGYIFSGIKKHSRIESCLKHIQNLVQQAGRQQSLWKPKTFDEKRYFNETYVIYNIIKSSKTQLRTDIFRCLMIHYPIPLMIYGQDGNLIPLYEQNFWIMNKAFNIVSFGLTKEVDGVQQQIKGKSELLNIIFETDFQTRSNLHRSCKGGINIQYKQIYQSNEYFVNLIDVSKKVDINTILELINASNMILIHTKQSDENYVNQWIKQKEIHVPMAIFVRDVKSIFDDNGKSARRDQKLKNNKSQDIKKYSLVQISIKSREYYNVHFNEIANSVQAFVRKCYENQVKKDFWNFSDFLAKKSGKDYLNFNKCLRDLQNTQEDLSSVTNHFYQWTKLNNIRDLVHQKQNHQKMQIIKKKASKQGINPIIQQIIYFYQKNSSFATEIMGKLRMFLSLIRNQIFRDFNELYKMLKMIDENCRQNEFLDKKKMIINLLDNISKNKTLINQKVKNYIKQFKEIQHLYKTSTNIEQRWKGIFKGITAQFENQIQPKVFSIQNFWRQVIYMSKFNSNYTFKTNNSPSICLYDTIVNLNKKQINNSQNFEIINGDLLEMPNEFLKKVFENQQNKKIMIVGIIGPQSSGKSTLLNFVLGCDFMSSAGRCTKGIYGTYFQISNKQIPNCQAILVLDTQGLFSNYRSQKFNNRNGFDNKLVLFCLKVCDLIIMNTKGDITNQCEQVLANAFDSQIIDAGNLPNVYFVLNCNGGPTNITQTKQIEKTCNEIIKLNPAASTVVSVTNSKGMSMAFNQTPRKTNATQISKYMLAKKMPSNAFYKDTIILSNQIFKILGERGKRRVGRTLSQAIDDMGLTWATIIRFSILTMHDNRKIKDLQQNIQRWVKNNTDLIRSYSLDLKRQLFRVSYKNLQKWQAEKISSLKKFISKKKMDFEAQFQYNKKESTNDKNLLKKAIQNIDSLFQSILQELKGSFTEQRYKLEMAESQSNGLDDIINLVKSIKNRQLVSNAQFGQEQKRKQFEQLWQQRIQNMYQDLDNQKIAVNQYKSMEQLYNSALKASDPTKSIYMIEKSQYEEIIQISKKSHKNFNDFLLKKINKKYEQQTIFQSSNQKPIMNIEKKVGDLSFKYLDMSKYFQYKIQQTGIYFKIQDIIQSLSADLLIAQVREKIKRTPSERKRRIILDLQHDFKILMGIELKQYKIRELIDEKINLSFYSFFNWIGFTTKIDIIKDSQNIRPNQKKKKFQLQDIYVNRWILDNKKGKNTKKREQLIKNIKILNLISQWDKEIIKISYAQQCPKSIQGNNEIINKIFSFVLRNIQKLLDQKLQIKSLQNDIERQLIQNVARDLQKINLSIGNYDQFITNLLSKRPINLYTKKKYQFQSQEKIRVLISNFGHLWNKQNLLKSYTKKDISEKYMNLIQIGYIKERKIGIKQKYKSEKILRTYIGKQYQQFLSQIHNSNFKLFIKKQLKYKSCFDQIHHFLFNEEKKKKSSLNTKISELRSRIHQILQQINKDLQQVSQKVRFDFIIDLHTYGFHLLWHSTSNQKQADKLMLIQDFNQTKQAQYTRFIMLSSGKPELQNQAASKSFTEEYVKFLNQQISNQKRQTALNLSIKYNKKYTRERIQEQVEHFLQNETDQAVLQNYLLKPEQYIQKMLQKQVRSGFIIQLQKFATADYYRVVQELKKIVSQLNNSISNINENSIEEVFEINLLDANKNNAFIQLFSEVILKKIKPYVSHQYQLGPFTIKQGRKFKITKDCNYKENIQFLSYITTKQIVITNLKLFCSSLIDDLKDVANQLQLQLSEQDKTEALKNLKIEICKKKCPLCKKSCDIDMFACPHHTVHQCNSGHQIRAIGGMAIEEVVQGKTVYKASILRCDDLTPDSKFQFNGKFYSWSQFKLEYQKQWDFTVSSKQNIHKALYKKLWQKVGKKICQHYSTQEKKFELVDYSQESIKRQTSSSSVLKSTHYIFAIDQSGSMSGTKWMKALESLKETIQEVSNNNQNNNQTISLIKFDDKASIVFESVAPQNFNKSAISFSGGGTRFGPVFQLFINLINKNPDKVNKLIFISDGEAEYPDYQIRQLVGLKNKGQNIDYTSIIIEQSVRKTAPIMQRITRELKGAHKLVVDATQIAAYLKQVHFKGKS